MRGCSLLGIVVGVLAAAAAGCGDDDGGPDFPDADSYKFDSGMDGGTASGRPDGGQIGNGGRMSGPVGGGTGVINGGTSGGAGVGAAGRGPVSGALNCDSNGTCLYPSGLVCFANGQCCYTADVVDGYCCVGNTCQMVPPWVALPTPDAGPPKPWVPPVGDDLVGEPGWRDSQDPLCFPSSYQAFGAQGVWSDSRGVFVSSLVQERYDPMNPDACFGCVRERVDFNDGSGWREIEGVSDDNRRVSQNPGLLLITGFDNGPLVLYGYTQVESGLPCGLSLVDDGMRECQPVDIVTDVAVVNDTLAYALLQGTLIRYDGTSWGPPPIQTAGLAELQLMWADPSVVMITGYSPGAIYTLRDGAITIENTRTLETFLSIFGFAPNDVFAGTWQGGLFHYDGTAWTKLEVPAVDCGEAPIYSMWGANGILYFATQTALMRWNGTSVEKLVQLDCNKAAPGQMAFTSLWGNSENEVFIGLTDTAGQTSECGPTFLLHYDGEKFHHM